MAEVSSIGASIAIAQAARTALPSAAGRSTGVDRIGLDGNLKPTFLAEVRAVLSNADARAALSIAIVAGNGIVSALGELKSAARLAQHEALVSELTDLTIGGDRISRLNLNVQASRTLAQIDRLVARSEVANANFISSTSPNIRIKTTRFGGSFDVVPQALDTTGLNLRGISLLSAESAANAESRLETAINTATRRIQGLESLQRAVSGTDYSGQYLSALIAGQSRDALPIGSLVNVVG